MNTARPVSATRAAEIGVALEAVVRLSRELTAPRSTPFGEALLTRTQLDIMFELAHARGPVSPSGLAETLRVTRGAITQTVEQLRDQGLVQQRAADHDGRVRELSLTDHARKMISDYETATVLLIAPRFDDLSESEMTLLAKLLSRV